MQIEVTVQSVTDRLRAELQRIPTNKGERVEGLSDEAYATEVRLCHRRLRQHRRAGEAAELPGLADEVTQRVGRRSAHGVDAARSSIGHAAKQLVERAVALELFAFGRREPEHFAQYPVVVLAEGRS